MRAREAAIEDAPVAAASARAGELARELRGELDQLVEREAARPYFHYQNLFHDPRASAAMERDAIAARERAGRSARARLLPDRSTRTVTTPSINDEFPQLCEPLHLVEHRAFREAVAQQLAQRARADRMAR